ncbi:DoxX family protein [Marinimicrobium alkaliphilum]|uniref:DoxX family protein n=1 Tax=Marinimicrobium alkaliphilum TaxID=2202654 RepID=UPI000DB9C09B|nr:DoxX family protein [Marinimicrobium alkaliphilum]
MVFDALSSLVGRCLLGFIFLGSGLGKIGGYAVTAESMMDKGLPLVDLLLIATIVIEVGAGALLMLGAWTRAAALVLIAWLVPVTLVFHNFWAMPPAEQELEMMMFMKNLAIMGGLLVLAAHGGGRWLVGVPRSPNP